MMTHLHRLCLLAAVLLWAGCSKPDAPAATATPDPHAGHDHAEHAGDAAPTDPHAGHDHAEHAGETHDEHDGHDHAEHADDAAPADAHAEHDHAEHAGEPHDDHAGHDHGANDGDLLVIGEEVGHIEYRHDEAAGTLTLWFLGPDAKTPQAPDVLPIFSYYSFDGRTPIVLVPGDQPHIFTATAAALKAPGLKGRFTVVIAKTPYKVAVDAATPHDHAHDH